MRIVKEKNESFKIVGTLNPYTSPDEGFVKGSVYPVFEGKDNDLYIGYTNTETDKEETPIYKCFATMSNNLKKSVKYLKDTKNTLENIQESYKIGDLSAYGFESEENKIYIGSLDRYIEFLSEVIKNTNDMYDIREYGIEREEKKILYKEYKKEDK